MLSIRSFTELTAHLQHLNSVKRLAVVNPTDDQTMEAIVRATKLKMITPILIGDVAAFNHKLLDGFHYMLIDCPDPVEASARAVEMVKSGEADILMKGMVNTDVILKAVLHKEKGLATYGKVITFIAAMEIPRYPKLLFMTDPAVIPAPNLRQRTAMIEYSIEMAHSFGIPRPKVALIHGTEKKNLKLNFMQDYVDILAAFKRGEFGEAIIDGPLDLFLALDPALGGIKKVDTLIHGDADALVFPGFEAANVFYKSMMSFADAQMGGMLYGTDKPVVLTSRSDSVDSKFYSIALGCLMNQNA